MSAIAAASPARAAAVCIKESAQAEALFNEGRALFDANRLDEACGRLAESQGIEPSVGTLGLLAACHEKQGHLVAAFREYVETAMQAVACGDEREAFAWNRAADLKLKLPHLRIDHSDHDAVIELRRGSVIVPQRTIGEDIVVDPGRIDISVRAPGKAEFRSIVELAEGARVRVIVPPLGPAKTAPRLAAKFSLEALLPAALLAPSR
jgi:hypothetical protein